MQVVGVERRRRWTPAEKLAIVRETEEPGMSVSLVARRHGVNANSNSNSNHPLGCHNPRVSDRAAMETILLVLRTGLQWNALSTTGICSGSSAYRRFGKWTEAGVFEAFWRRGLMRYDELVGID